MQRRDVLKTGAAFAAAAVMPQIRAAETSKTIGIQMEVGPVHERGAGHVLDDIQTRAHVNTVFLRAFSYTDTRSGMTKPGFHGGNFATVHQQYYKGLPVSMSALQAPDLGDYDVLADFIPEAKKRGVKTYCWVIEDNFKPPFDGFDQMWERDLYGNINTRHPAQGCLNNPL
ncbi:MAG: twin-arginine translocation signal domain-containing protein, partial [Anaerolineaceae bacterium]|nr:twin-arginine translocation signal domain-containing protein [Anaerolineaceae bacterium]